MQWTQTRKHVSKRMTVSQIFNAFSELTRRRKFDTHFPRQWLTGWPNSAQSGVVKHKLKPLRQWDDTIPRTDCLVWPWNLCLLLNVLAVTQKTLSTHKGLLCDQQHAKSWRHNGVLFVDHDSVASLISRHSPSQWTVECREIPEAITKVIYTW